MEEQINTLQTSTDKTEDPNIKFERFKYFVELAKWFIVSVALVIMTTIIDAGFKDRASGIQEIQQYDKYVTDLIVLNKEVGPRRLLAQYFANVTASDKLREHWKDYYKEVDFEYRQYLIQDSIVKAKLAVAQSKDTVKITVKEKQVIQNLQQKANELNRQINSNIKLPTDNGVKLSSASISLSTQDDDKDFDTKVSVVLSNSSNQIISNTQIGDNLSFPDNSIQSFALPINGTVSKNDIINGILKITINTNGNDDWHFIPKVTLRFSDGSVNEINNFTVIRLSRSNNSISLSF
jgi:hypothetical protein